MKIGPAACLPLLSVLVLACNGKADSPKPVAAPVATKDSTPAIGPDTAMVQNGHVRMVGPDGHLQMEGDMAGGKRSGLWTGYTRDGRVKSRSEYKDGLPEGISTVFRDDGTLFYTGNQQRGRQVGEWRYYNTEGQLERTVVYDTSGAVINDRGKGR